MVVDSVLYDRELTFGAKCVFGVLARHYRPGGRIVLGVRRIAHLLGCSPQTVQEGLQALEKRQHIQISRLGNMRSSYSLISNRFANKKWRAEADGEVIEAYKSDGVLHRRLIQSRPA